MLCSVFPQKFFENPIIFFQSVEDFATFISPDQPLISSAVVTQADIDRQEAIVKETRLKLAEAIEALYG